MRYRPGLPLVLKGLNVNIEAGTTCGVVGRTGQTVCSRVSSQMLRFKTLNLVALRRIWCCGQNRSDCLLLQSLFFYTTCFTCPSDAEAGSCWHSGLKCSQELRKHFAPCYMLLVTMHSRSNVSKHTFVLRVCCMSEPCHVRPTHRFAA